jgi:hypothetical protein
MDCLSIALAITMHIGLQGDYNQAHPHVRCDINNTVAGAFYNSEKNISAYVGYQFEMPSDITLEIGWASGYDYKKGIVPFGRVSKGNWFITPAYETNPNEKWGITLGYEFPLYKKD